MRGKRYSCFCPPCLMALLPSRPNFVQLNFTWLRYGLRNIVTVRFVEGHRVPPYYDTALCNNSRLLHSTIKKWQALSSGSDLLSILNHLSVTTSWNIWVDLSWWWLNHIMLGTFLLFLVKVQTVTVLFLFYATLSKDHPNSYFIHMSEPNEEYTILAFLVFQSGPASDLFCAIMSKGRDILSEPQ